MENLGLFKGSPKQVLAKDQALALFRENQKNRKLTRVPGDQFRIKQEPDPEQPETPTSTGDAASNDSKAEFLRSEAKRILAEGREARRKRLAKQK